jgi:hypothetical protein
MVLAIDLSGFLAAVEWDTHVESINYELARAIVSFIAFHTALNIC